MAVVASFGLKAENFSAFVDVVHCIHPVQDEIEEHLLEADGVTQHDGKRGRKVGANLDAATHSVSSDDFNNVFDESINIDGLDLHLAFLSKVANSGDGFAGAEAIVANVRDDAANFIERNIFQVEERIGDFGVIENRIQRLIHFVRDHGCQFANNGKARSVDQFFASLFSPFAV